MPGQWVLEEQSGRPRFVGQPEGGLRDSGAGYFLLMKVRSRPVDPLLSPPARCLTGKAHGGPGHLNFWQIRRMQPHNRAVGMALALICPCCNTRTPALPAGQGQRVHCRPGHRRIHFQACAAAPSPDVRMWTWECRSIVPCCQFEPRISHQFPLAQWNRRCHWVLAGWRMQRLPCRRSGYSTRRQTRD